MAYELSGWQIQQMEEDARNRMWEDLNEPEPEVITEANDCITAAIGYLNRAIGKTEEADALFNGSPEAFKVASITNDLVVALDALRKIRGRW